MQNNMSARLRLLQMLELPGAVTISTNMAGRGTDIVLGGRPLEDASEKQMQAGLKNMRLL